MSKKSNKYANENFNELLLTSSFLAEKNIRVLKHNETFGIFDRYGDIAKRNEGEQGLYHAGSRFLSKCEFLICGKKPLLLSSFISDDNSILMVDLTNPEIGAGRIPSGAVHIMRSIFLWDKARHDLFKIHNYLIEPVELTLDFSFEADYSDIFEVRGHKRQQRGFLNDPQPKDGNLVLSYLGLDEISRYTVISTSSQTESLGVDGLSISTKISPRGSTSEELKCLVGLDSEPLPKNISYTEAYRLAKNEVARRRGTDASVTTSNEQFNDLINRSFADIHLLITTTNFGPYPYAGVPWFSTTFGRDGIIAAIEMLWINPSLAKTVLHFLAETQGSNIDEENDCEPGKILHEARQGEMANLGEIPFKKYYGSVDSTPLFVALAGSFYKRTGDKEFIKSIWTNIKAALKWIDEYGDCDGDGFVEYRRHSSKGLVHQGWKDSDNSIFHDDGELAEAPIALCEVQGYVYSAFKRGAYLASVMGEDKLADYLSQKKQDLREKFHQYFWLNDVGYFALALDKDKNPCRVKSSNVGHCLYTGLIHKEHAERAAEVLMSPEMFSGWGVRTIGENEPLYNPMSYHNGTIWPHDCAFVGAGMARYGLKDRCIKILTGLFDASNLVDFHRLPELFCGFGRGPGKNPTIYPMSCAPQAWAAGSIFLLLGSSLGIKIKAETNVAMFFHPKLPSYIESVTIRNLQINSNATLDLTFTNHGEDVGVNILKRSGQAKVVVVK